MEDSSLTAVSDIAFDNENNLFYYMKFDTAINKFNGANLTTIKIPGLSFYDLKISFDKNNNLWIAGYQQLIGQNAYEFIGDKWRNPWDSILVQPIESIFSDKNGNMWVTTQSFIFGRTETVDENLGKFDGKEWNLLNVKTPALPSKYIYNIAIDLQNNKWIGTDNGLAVTDDINWEVYDTTNSIMPLNSVSYIAIDSNGTKWVGLTNWSRNNRSYHSSSALIKIKNNAWTMYDSTNSILPNSPILSIKIDKNGNKWIGTACRGLIKFNDTEWTLYNTKNSKLPSDSINALAVDKENRIWIGTDKGLAKYDGKSWVIYDSTNSLSSSNVSAIGIDYKDNIWIGLDNGTVFKFNNYEWTTDPININGITGIVADNTGIVWIISNSKSTSTGFWEYNGKNWNWIESGHFSTIAIDSKNKKWLGNLATDLMTLGISVYSGVDTFITDATYDVESNVIDKFHLFQKYPNPFNPSTTIKYQFRKNHLLLLEYMNAIGREVATLVNKQQSAGYYNLNFNAANLASGIYFYRLTAGDFSAVQKMLLLK